MYFSYMSTPNLIHQGGTINNGKAYAHLYNLDDIQNHPPEHTSEYFPVKGIMTFKFYKGLMYKIELRDLSKGKN